MAALDHAVRFERSQSSIQSLPAQSQVRRQVLQVAVDRNDSAIAACRETKILNEPFPCRPYVAQLESGTEGLKLPSEPRSKCFEERRVLPKRH